MNPHLATALSAQGSLLLARARAARDRAARLDAARQAEQAFAAAFRENPLLRRDGAALEAEAAVLRGEE